jgi:hypothetical protein
VDLAGIVGELKKERERLDRAIAALGGAITGEKSSSAGVRKRSGMTPAARKRLSLAMKRRWAESRRKGKKSL